MKHCFTAPLKLPCPNLVNTMSELICSGFFFIHNYLKDIFSMSNFYLSTLTIGVFHTSDLYMYPLPCPSFWNITVLWSSTTQIVITHICVIFSRTNMSLSICPMVQLLYRFFVGNENIEQTSKSEASFKINYYFSDLIIKLQQLE